MIPESKISDFAESKPNNNRLLIEKNVIVAKIRNNKLNEIIVGRLLSLDYKKCENSIISS